MSRLIINCWKCLPMQNDSTTSHVAIETELRKVTRDSNSARGSVDCETCMLSELVILRVGYTESLTEVIQLFILWMRVESVQLLLLSLGAFDLGLQYLSLIRAILRRVSPRSIRQVTRQQSSQGPSSLADSLLCRSIQSVIALDSKLHQLQSIMHASRLNSLYSSFRLSILDADERRYGADSILAC
jgi:hypothetical protein